MLTFLKACSRCCDGDSEEDSSEIRARLYEGYQNSEEEGSEYHQSGDESDLGSEEVSLLIMEAQNRRKKTYGTRASKTSTRANGIFGASPSASRSPLDELTESLANVQIKPTRPSPSPSSKISTLNLEGHNDEDDIESIAKVVTKQSGDQPDFEDAINDLSTAIQEQLLDEVIDPVAEAVRPLQDVYEADRGESMMIMTWEEVLTGVTTIDKIAEASFAQVFRVTNKEGSSILKFIELKTPHDPASMRSETAANVETVVPEFRMMNALAEVPGFLNFKDAHVLMGKPTAIIQNAYDRFVERKQENVDEDFESWFPSPDSYSENAVFLALELGDAGTVLEDFDQGMDHDGCPMCGLGHVEWVWDILLGVIIALSRAEELYQFEHRDLHENNICVKLSKAIHDFPATVDDDEQPKLGRSGLEITILDYGLSRATLGGDEIYSDLEADLEVFQSESENGNKREDLQFNTYRRMRNHLFSGKYGLTSSAWHGEDSRKKSNGHSWNEYIPYTNVLWIGYIYEFLRESFADGKLTKEQRRFRAETKEFAGRLKPTPNNIYRFANATDILQYALDQGWATTEQLEGYGVDTSIFSDESESE